MVYAHASSSNSSFSSASGHASASGSRLGPSLPHSPPPPPPEPSTTPPSQPVKRRRYARRSCLTCRSKKTRCELPDEAVASSHDPLPVYKACHRCRALDIPCVVWDGDRKRKPRINSASSARPPPPPPTPPSHAHSYSYGQNLPADLRNPDYSGRINRSYSPTLPVRTGHRDGQLDGYREPTSPPRRWFSPPSSNLDTTGANSGLSPRRSADLYERPRYIPGPSPSNRTSHSSRPPNSTTVAHTITPSSSAAQNSSSTDGQYDAALFIDPNSSETIKTKVTGHQWPLLSNRFMHSPLFTLNRFITKLPSFSRLLRPDMDRSFDGEFSGLLTDENIHQLQSHVPRLRMWHPHLPDLDSLCVAFRGRSTPSTSLLLASMCLVASKVAGKRHLAKHFAVHVDRIGLQVLISAPKELHAAQAFELLLSHEPSLIGASVDPSGTAAASTESAVFGGSLHSSAISIAEAIGLDLVMSQALQNGSNPTATPPEDDEQVRSKLRRFSLWCSLSIWRSKFIYLNSVIRPIDFSRLRRDAELATEMVDRLQPSAGGDADALKDDVLFRAGVLALAFRAIQLADLHARLSQLETLWKSRPLFSEVEVRNEISSRVDQNLEFLEDLKKTKRRKLWSIADLAELRFIDRWIDLEFESDWVFLFTLYMRMVLPLPTSEAAVTVLDVSQSIGQDADLFQLLYDVSQRSFLNNERVIAGFAATPRFEGEHLEQTGLPLLLTCGYILHICICLMESAGFAQYGLHDLAMRVDMFAHLLPQLSDRICGPERSKGESLEKLVSSMLVQMTRRLNELEFYKATQHTKQTSSASATTAPSSAPTGDSHPHRSSDQHDTSGHLSSQAHFSSPQRYATASSDSSAVSQMHTPSTMWQTASGVGQPDIPKQAPGIASRALSSHIHRHDVGEFFGSDNVNANASAAAVSFPTNTASLLSSSDAWSSDNMARIMDQILSWDYMQDVPPAHGS